MSAVRFLPEAARELLHEVEYDSKARWSSQSILIVGGPTTGALDRVRPELPFVADVKAVHVVAVPFTVFGAARSRWLG